MIEQAVVAPEEGIVAAKAVPASVVSPRKLGHALRLGPDDPNQRAVGRTVQAIPVALLPGVRGPGRRLSWPLFADVRRKSRDVRPATGTSRPDP